jgi:membrane-associated phospholipid phosphatase
VVLATLFTFDQSLTNSFQAHGGFPGLSQKTAGTFVWLGNGVSDFTLAEAWRALGDGDVANQAGADSARAILNAGVNVQVLKTLFGRGNPGIGPGTGQFTGPQLLNGHDSFPSGHTATAFAFATSMSRYYPQQKKYFYGMATLVGISTLAVHIHFPSDVYAGALLGVASGNEAIHGDRNFLMIKF